MACPLGVLINWVPLYLNSRIVYFHISTAISNYRNDMSIVTTPPPFFRVLHGSVTSWSGG